MNSIVESNQFTQLYGEVFQTLFNADYLETVKQGLIVGDHEHVDQDTDVFLVVLENILVFVVILLIYVLLMGAGFFAFPPLMICLAVTGGDLNSCSFGIW